MRRLAIVLSVLAACGDDKPASQDAAIRSDGAPPDTPLEPVTLTITDKGTPMSGVHVYFQHADSTLVRDAITDAAGRASASVNEGGFVTAINPFAQVNGGVYDDLRTFVGVKPGDQLVLEIPNITGIDVTLNAPLSSATGAVNYSAYSTCNLVTGVSITNGTNAPTGTFSLDGCGAMTDFLVIAYDVDNKALEYIYAPDVAVAEGATIDLSTRTYTAAPARAFSFTSIPASFGAFSVYDTVVSPRGPLARVGGVTAAGALTMNVPAFTGATDLVKASAISGIAQHTFVDWGPYTAGYATNVTSRVLPEITALPTIDFANPSVVWTEAAGGVMPDVTTTAVSACRAADTRCWDWFLVSPHVVPRVSLPTLPTTIYDYNLKPGDMPQVFDLVIAKVPGGWDAVRAIGLNVSRPTEFVGGTSGSITYEELAPVLRPARRRD